ncbi:DUF86 domain-containing protein [Candidatus Bathyarchaeota archaeon]|nr:DUF86 domain-containing protein [Candidatus Bathyarchaeota archaeon]
MPRFFREAFIRLAVRGVIGADTAQSMAGLVSLRNIIVHRYWIVDDLKIYDFAEKSGVNKIEKFIEEVISYVKRKPSIRSIIKIYALEEEKKLMKSKIFLIHRSIIDLL